MKRTFGIFLIILAAVLLANCAPASTSSTEGAQPTEPQVVEPTAAVKNTITLSQDVDVTSLDPQAYVTNDGFVGANIFDTLLRFKPNGDIEPNLADSYEISQDGMTYTFVLKQGVKFQNGDELKASDVVFTFKRGNDYPNCYNWASRIADVKALDDYTVQATMKEPYALMLREIGGNAAILSERATTEAGEDFKNHPIGTGPYTLQEWLPGDKIILTAFPDYFKGKAPIETVTYKIIQDQTAIAIALESGDLDFARNMTTVDLLRLQKDPKLHFVIKPSTLIFYQFMNTSKPPFNDINVREAFAHAIDVHALNMTTKDGVNIEAKSMINDQVFGWTDKIQGYDFDLEKAKSYLADAGYPNGEGFPDIKIGCIEPFKQIAVFIQDAVKGLGLNLEVEVFEPNTYPADIMNGKSDFGVMAGGWPPDAGAQEMNFTTAGIETGENMSFYSNPTVDELFAQANSETNQDTRKEELQNLFVLLDQEVVYIPFYFEPDMYLANANLNIDKMVEYGTKEPYFASWK